MRYPNIIRLTPEWRVSLTRVQVNVDGHYVPCRPYGYQGFFTRLRATWLVWTGRADALIWPEDYLRDDELLKEKLG